MAKSTRSGRNPLAEARESLAASVRAAFRQSVADGALPDIGDIPDFQIEVPAHREHGDFAANAALALARAVGRPPRQIAEALRERLLRSATGGAGDEAAESGAGADGASVVGAPSARGMAIVRDVQIAGPGFINFFLDPAWLAQVADWAREETWGRSEAGSGSVVVEFVSANPTGPLNVVNARAAAYGDSLCNVLDAAGHAVTREFYVNDAGNQFNRFAQSVAVRYAQKYEGAEDLAIPEGGYPGEYVFTLVDDAIAAFSRLADQFDVDERGDKPSLPDPESLEWLPAAFPGSGGEHGDSTPTSAAFRQASTALASMPPEGRQAWLGRLALESLLAGQRKVLAAFRVDYDRWSRESALRAAGKAEEMVARLESTGHTYVSDGATWLRTTDFGDDRDRVLRRGNGTLTYIVPDIAYHLDKLARADVAIDLLGPDHHGYLARLKASLAALGLDPERLEFLVSQMVHLVRGGDRLKMSKRQGDFVSMDDFLLEVDVDAARWFFVARAFDSPMEFDLDLANLKTNENPVYYVQYAHARIASLLERATAEGVWQEANDAGAAFAEGGDAALGDAPHAERFAAPSERALLWELVRFPDEVALAAAQRAPHRLTTYAHDLASAYHGFYTECRVLDAETSAQRDDRLLLSHAARHTLARCLDLLGVTAPDHM